ncbi:FGGY family carbohydrate kinase [Bacillus atrophaeus]
MGDTYIIGVDIGTTSTKAVLYKKNGQLMESHGVDYPLETPTVYKTIIYKHYSYLNW